jgi:predicted nucleotidyltransferase
MTNISLDLSGKIDKKISDLLKEIKNITKPLGIRFFVIGATARDIILEAGYGVSSGRKTKDVDFAVMVEDWPGYDRLKRALFSTGHIIENKKILHRLRFKDVLEVDVLPFGEIENPKGSIKWPEDSSVMKVIGFREALESGILVKIDPTLQVPFVSPHGMAALKLIAWVDRRHEFPEKDISRI